VEIIRRLGSLIALSILWGCTATEALVGHPRAPISPDQVRIYLEAPARYDRIAILESTSQFSFALTPDGKTEAVVQRLKRAAAQLGANGILLQGISDEGAASIGGGAGASTYSNHGSVDLGFGGFSSGERKYGSGLAIYVAPGQAPNAPVH
jgi:hypothetical protein